MHWIEELRYEIRRIKNSSKDLRKFGITIGTAIILVSLLSLWKEWLPFSTTAAFIAAGVLCIVVGFIHPALLKIFHQLWMGFAIVLGSVVSRIILLILFFVIVTPIGILARVFGKKFSFSYQEKGRKSYWIERDKTKKINYERMS